MSRVLPGWELIESNKTRSTSSSTRRWLPHTSSLSGRSKICGRQKASTNLVDGGSDELLALLTRLLLYSSLHASSWMREATACASQPTLSHTIFAAAVRLQ